MDNVREYLPIIIPLAVIQLGLMAAALVHVFRHKSYRVGNRALWVVLSVALSIIGPVLYFCIGRDDEGRDA